MADEAVVRIVLEDEGTPPSVSQAAPAAAPPHSSNPAPSPPPPPPKPAPIDPSKFGSSYTETAKNLLRPMQFMDDRKKELAHYRELLAHPELQSTNLQKEIKRLGEGKLDMLASYRKNMGKPDVPDEPDTTYKPPEPTKLPIETARPPKPPPTLPPPIAEPVPAPPPVAKLAPPPKPAEPSHDYEIPEWLKNVVIPEKKKTELAPPPKPPTPPPPTVSPQPYQENAPSERGDRTYVGEPGSDFYKRKKAEAESKSKKAEIDLGENEENVPRGDRTYAGEPGSDFYKRKKAEAESIDSLLGNPPKKAEVDIGENPKPEPPRQDEPEDAPIGEHTYVGLPGKPLYKKRKAQAEGTYGKPTEPESEPPFDPVEEAKKWVKRQEQREAVEAEYAKLRPPKEVANPPFDPLEQAKKRIKAEEQRAAVDAEYQKLKPQQNAAKGAFDGLFEAAEGLRGIIGGTFGTVMGAALDVTANLRRLREKAAKAEISRPTEANDAPGPKAAIPLSPNDAAKTVTSPMSEQVKDQKLATQRAAPTAEFAPIAEYKNTKSAISSLAESTGLASMKMAAMVPIVAGATVAFGAITSALDTAVERYADYSPEVSQAKANAEINKTQNDMRRAQENGPELARYVESQARMQERFEEAKMQILMKLAPTIETIMDVVGPIATILAALPTEIALAMAIRSGNPLAMAATATIEILSVVKKLTDKEVNDPTSILADPSGINPGEAIPEI